MLKDWGIKKKPRVARYMDAEIASGDQGRILRAFNDAVYMRYWPKSDVSSALEGYLNHPNPFIRYLAAQDFLITGDHKGYATLLALVQSQAPLEGLKGTGDLRVQAAAVLGRYRQKDAVSAIAALDSQTSDGEVSLALADLGAPMSSVANVPFVETPFTLTYYARRRATQFIPQITSTFYKTPKPDVKAAAAWALAKLTNDQNAIAYLIQAAQTALQDPLHTGAENARALINDVGSIQTSAAKETLEAALDSRDPGVVTLATLNLIVNQGGSAKANHMVAQALTPGSNRLGVDMALNLAPRLLDDPQVKAAAENFARSDGSGAWQRAMERKDWSIYNWASGIYTTPPE